MDTVGGSSVVTPGLRAGTDEEEGPLLSVAVLEPSHAIKTATRNKTDTTRLNVLPSTRESLRNFEWCCLNPALEFALLLAEDRDVIPLLDVGDARPVGGCGLPALRADTETLA